MRPPAGQQPFSYPFPPFEGHSSEYLPPPEYQPCVQNPHGFTEGDLVPTGPTEYNVDIKLCLSVGSYLFIIQHLAKFAAAAVWFTDNRQHESSNWRYLGLLLVASVFNLWLPLLVGYRSYMTHSRYEMSRLLKTPFPYLFLLDEVILSVVPAAGERLGLVAEIPILVCIIVAFLNFICFWLVLKMEVINYQPLQSNAAFPHLTNSFEERTSDYVLKIIESSAFKIVIQNISSEPIKGDYIVVRKTREARVSRRRGPVKNKCTFSFKVDWWLDPGATITLIPETHSLAGAIQIKDFRSFGYDRKDHVQTSIYKDVAGWKDHLCVRFMQNYSK